MGLQLLPLTLDQYTRALQQGWDSLKNSMILGLVAALLGGLLGMVIAYITAKRNYYGKRFIEVSSVLMFAVPGTVLGIAYILAFNTGFLVLTGTAAILVIVFVFRNMPVAIESGTTTLLQIDNSIEEASTILGAGSGYSFRRITLPMLRNAFLRHRVLLREGHHRRQRGHLPGFAPVEPGHQQDLHPV